MESSAQNQIFRRRGSVKDTRLFMSPSKRHLVDQLGTILRTQLGRCSNAWITMR